MSQESESTTSGSAADSVPSAQSADSAGNVTSPGELLRRTRESLNLTIGDLAGQTRLSRAVLEALENNDFASLAMPVYVRGYFRKCAHVLNLPEERLLQAYADWTGTPLKPQPLPVTVSEPPEEYVTPGRTPSWRYILIIAVVIGAVLWWFGSGDSTTVPPATVTDAGMTALEIDPAPVTENARPLPLPLTTDGTPTPETPARPGSPAATDTVSSAADATATSEAATAPADGPRVTSPPAGPTTLELKISRTSWVEIYDDDKVRLVYGLLQTGTEQRVAGKPPYEVVLGHPQGVSLSMGGKAIDLSAYTSRNGTARFEIEKP